MTTKKKFRKSWALVILGAIVTAALVFGAPGCGAGVGSGISVTINSSKG